MLVPEAAMAASRSPEKGEVLMSDRTQILVSDGEALQQDPVAQQHELLVSEIESTDGHLGTALRCVCICFSLVLTFSLDLTLVYIAHCLKALSTSQGFLWVANIEV